MSLRDLPKGMEPIFSEVNYSDLKTIDEVYSLIEETLKSDSYIKAKDLHFVIEQKLSGYRPVNKFYVGDEVMFIIKYMPPRCGDIIFDKELCILHPQHFKEIELKKLLFKIMENSKYTFFWKDASPFSQWHDAGFLVEGIHFKTAEHYMMFKKAMLFNDIEKAAEILEAVHPRDVKKKGREVKNFVAAEWEAKCKQFVYEGNYAKFMQNKDLYEKLMTTGDTILVEASPYDKIWGIGLTEAEAKKIPADQWPGTNWLGEVLTELRENLKEEEKLKQ